MVDHHGWLIYQSQDPTTHWNNNDDDDDDDNVDDGEGDGGDDDNDDDDDNDNDNDDDDGDDDGDNDDDDDGDYGWLYQHWYDALFLNVSDQIWCENDQNAAESQGELEFWMS